MKSVSNGVESSTARIIAKDISDYVGRTEDIVAPFVTVTFAQSLDGSIAANRNQQLFLSGESSLKMTHELRSIHDAILVGVGTVISDNPSLTVRRVRGKNPQPIIVDSRLRMPLSCKLLTSSLCVRPIILTTMDNDKSKSNRLSALLSTGARIIKCFSDTAGRVDLKDGLSRVVKESAIKSIMVEGGASILNSFILGMKNSCDANVNQIVITISPCFVGGVKYLTDSNPSDTVVNAIQVSRLESPQFEKLGDDIVVSGRVK